MRCRNHLTLLALTLASLQAQAASPSAQAIFEQLNVVVANDLVSTSHVDGRTFVGGNVTANGADFAQGNNGATSSPSAYSGLNVGGNLGGWSSHVNSGAGASIVGNASNLISNGGNVLVGGTATNVVANGGGTLGTWSLPSLASPVSTLTQLSNSLKSLTATTGTSVSDNGYGKITFTNTSSADFVVFDLTAIDQKVFTANEFEFNLGSAKTIIFNTDESSYDNVHANFLAGSAPELGNKVIWNFYNASTINLGAQFGGNILAMGATLTNWNNIEGDTFVRNLAQHGEIHHVAGGFTGNIPAVPEPETYALFLAGLGFVGMMARRRRLPA